MPGDPVCDGIELAVVVTKDLLESSVHGGEACLEFSLLLYLMRLSVYLPVRHHRWFRHLHSYGWPSANDANIIYYVRTLLQTTSSACWKRFCFQRTSAISALDVSRLTTMRSTNLHFTYLLACVAGAVARSAIHATKCESCRQLLINSDATLEPLKSDATLNYSFYRQYPSRCSRTPFWLHNSAMFSLMASVRASNTSEHQLIWQHSFLVLIAREHSSQPMRRAITKSFCIERYDLTLHICQPLLQTSSLPFCSVCCRCDCLLRP